MKYIRQTKTGALVVFRCLYACKFLFKLTLVGKIEYFLELAVDRVAMIRFISSQY